MLYRAAKMWGMMTWHQKSGTWLSLEAKIRTRARTPAPVRSGNLRRGSPLCERCDPPTSIRLENRFERHFRDLHVLMQHSDKSSTRYASAGRLMLGLENDWVWLSF